MIIRHYESVDLFITFTFNSKTNKNVFEMGTYRVIPYSRGGKPFEHYVQKLPFFLLERAMKVLCYIQYCKKKLS